MHAGNVQTVGHVVDINYMHCCLICSLLSHAVFFIVIKLLVLLALCNYDQQSSCNFI